MPTQNATREHIERRSTPPMGDTTPQETRDMQGKGEGSDTSRRPKRNTRKTPRYVIEQIAALAATTDMSQHQIAQAVGIPRTTVQGILAKLEQDDATFVQLRQAQKREWVRQAWAAVEHLTIAATKGAEHLLARSEELTARDVRDLTVAAGILVDKSALVLGETQTGGSSGLTRDIADAVLSAWHAGREEGRREASPLNITPGKLIDA